MGNGQVLNTDVSRLNFLYKRISMSNGCLMSWMKVPEFADAMNQMLDSQIEITDSEVLSVCTRLLNGKFKDEESREGFFFQSMRRGANHLQKILGENQ